MSTEAAYQLYVENDLYKAKEVPCHSEEEAMKKYKEYPKSKVIYDWAKQSCTIYTPNENVTQDTLLRLLSEANYDECCRRSSLQEKQLACQKTIKNILVFFCFLVAIGLVVGLLLSLK